MSHDFGHFVPFDQVANNFGLVCIVTNAVPGWVEKTIKKLVKVSDFASFQREMIYKFLIYTICGIHLNSICHFEYTMYSQLNSRRWLPDLRSYVGSGSAHCERPIKVIYAQEVMGPGGHDSILEESKCEIY